MGAVKIVHTADAHLGKRFPFMAKEAEALRSEDVFSVFEELVTYVIKNSVHLVLVAGDLFARANIRRETISRVLELFSRIHEKLPHTRIVLTPGEDELFIRKDRSVDCTLKVLEHLSYVDVIGADADKVDRMVYELNGQDVTVSSCAYDRFFIPDFRPTRILPVKRGFGIFLLHAYSRRHRLSTLEDDEFADAVLKPLAARGYGYCALGHRHEMTVIDGPGIQGVHPGSLERLSVDTDRGKKYFIALALNDEGAPGPIEPIRTRVRPLEYITMTCSLGEANAEQTLAEMVGRGGRDKILYVVLEGQMDFQEFHNLKNSDTFKELSERYAIVHLDNRLILVDGASGFDFNALRVGTPVEEFRRYMERELSQVDPDGEEYRLLAELFEIGMREIEQEL